MTSTLFFSPGITAAPARSTVSEAAVAFGSGLGPRASAATSLPLTRTRTLPMPPPRFLRSIVSLVDPAAGAFASICGKSSTSLKARTSRSGSLLNPITFARSPGS
jgi:hypothetical protein